MLQGFAAFFALQNNSTFQHLPTVRNLTAICIIALAGSVARAELQSVDLITPGDSLVTLDTETEFQWLDLTQTLGISVNQFEANPPLGFVIANADQVRTLFVHAGLPIPAGLNNHSDPALTARFQDLVGLTYQSGPPQYRYSAGVALDRGSPSGVGYFNAALQDDNRWFTYYDNARGNPIFTRDFENPEGGIWAVHVSEPSTCALFAVGLLPISLAARNRKCTRLSKRVVEKVPATDY